MWYKWCVDVWHHHGVVCMYGVVCGMCAHCPLIHTTSTHSQTQYQTIFYILVYYAKTMYLGGVETSASERRCMGCLCPLITWHHHLSQSWTRCRPNNMMTLDYTTLECHRLPTTGVE